MVEVWKWLRCGRGRWYLLTLHFFGCFFSYIEINEVNEENLKLERLYSTSQDELTVDVNHDVSEAGSIFRMNGQPQLKIRRNNPFRSPMYKIKKEEQVFSRYYMKFYITVFTDKTT